jgi:hypothetical protein
MEMMDACGRWCTLLRSFTWLKAEYLTPASEAAEEMVYYAPSVHWLVKRGKVYSFAAKGGHNCEPHNQHDIGSFILAKNGHQILTDPGSGVYTRQYFSGPRYTYVSCGSHGHSVPYFGTDEDRAEKGFFYGYQKDGKQFCARDVAFEGDTFTLDIGPAYGEAFVRRVTRTFILGEHGFTLRDEFDVDGGIPITERLVSLTPFEVGEGCAVTDLATLTYDPALYEVSTSVGDFRPETPVYFLDLRLREGVTAFEVTVTV